MQTIEWFQGASDAEKGVEHQEGRGDMYDRGYAAQYELDQIKTHISESNEQRNF